jgi:hypothetical protein
MRVRAHTVAAVGVIVVVAAARLAQAQEGPPLAKGIAADAWAAAVDDRSVLDSTSGENHRDESMLFGISVLGHLGEVVMGANLDGFPGFFGDARLSVGGLAGWQPTGDRFRMQILAEGGGHYFRDVGGSLFASPVGTNNHWLPYAGLRVGATMSFSEHGYSRMGVWLFARHDIGEASARSVSGNWMGGDDTYTDFKLGGFQAGVALRFGMMVAK